MDFDAKGNPEEEYKKWREEYFRLEGQLYKNFDSGVSRQAEQAKKFMNYFSKAKKTASPSAKGGFEETTPLYPREIEDVLAKDYRRLKDTDITYKPSTKELNQFWEEHGEEIRKKMGSSKRRWPGWEKIIGRL